MHFKIVGTELRTTRFKITWTISRTDYKNMKLGSEAEYKELVTETGKKAKVEAKLEISECELEAPPPAADGDGPGTAAGNATPAASAQNEEPADKHKHRKLNPEEEAMAKTIIDIQNPQRCSDRTCTSRFCFVGNPTAKHVRLTPLLLNTWAAAILAEMPNVTVTEPPPPEEEKMFWPLDDQLADIDDISMLASLRPPIIAASTSALNRGREPTEPLSTPKIPRRLFGSPAKPAKMDIPDFCAAFGLGDDILQRLVPMKLDGPQLLKYVDDKTLDLYLELGQRAKVRWDDILQRLVPMKLDGPQLLKYVDDKTQTYIWNWGSERRCDGLKTSGKWVKLGLM
ncbi:hypothetical protein C8F04DRAFT_1271854 [Mycena alexandri]|uniref:Uncharacterized protein n=1 Tax=Mycena alexandri TaxID=1745969 RepID=A0AAD6WRW9_9AGAR|nr:hypothetical protein C8F04DRAFT_1271854 [Mycena alexandri]